MNRQGEKDWLREPTYVCTSWSRISDRDTADRPTVWIQNLRKINLIFKDILIQGLKSLVSRENEKKMEKWTN